MKRIFFMFLALLLCVMVQAQVNVEITLNNGNVVKGVTKTLFMLDDGDVVVAKDSKSREKKEYKSTEIKSIKYYDSKSNDGYSLRKSQGLNPSMDFSYKRNCIGSLTIMQPFFIISSFIYLHRVYLL